MPFMLMVILYHLVSASLPCVMSQHVFVPNPNKSEKDS